MQLLRSARSIGCSLLGSGGILAKPSEAVMLLFVYHAGAAFAVWDLHERNDDYAHLL